MGRRGEQGKGAWPKQPLTCLFPTELQARVLGAGAQGAGPGGAPAAFHLPRVPARLPQGAGDSRAGVQLPQEVGRLACAVLCLCTCEHLLTCMCLQLRACMRVCMYLSAAAWGHASVFLCLSVRAGISGPCVLQHPQGPLCAAPARRLRDGGVHPRAGRSTLRGPRHQGAAGVLDIPGKVWAAGAWAARVGRPACEANVPSLAAG